MRTAVVSAIYGGVDAQKIIPTQALKTGEEVEYFFLNEVNTPMPDSLNNRDKGKAAKILTHTISGIQKGKFDYIVWVDGSLLIQTESWLQFMLDSVKGKDIAVFKHPDRNTIFEELEYVIHEINSGNKYLKNRYNPASLFAQATGYKGEVKGLYACGMFIRKNSPKVNKCFDDWWEENMNFPLTLDQISFPYVLQKHKLNTHVIDLNIFENSHFKFIPHAK